MAGLRSEAVEVVDEPAETRHADIEACKSPLATIFSTSSLPAPAAGGRAFLPPDKAQRKAMARAISALSTDNWHDAIGHAHRAGYRMCRSADVAVLLPHEEHNYRARIALRLGEANPLVFEAPHPFHDRGTVEQGHALFDSVGARALIVSGTYRCDSAGVSSGHPGHTTACGGRQPYAVSDMAHTVDTIFHQAHVSLFRAYDQATFVSLHGMAQKGVSLSNGTRLPLRHSHAANAPVARLTGLLESELGSAPVTTCNAHAGTSPKYRLCGTTNVQGRHANGYPNASVVEPLRASGRFIHMEQSFAVRQNVDAIARAFAQWLET